MTKTTIMKDNRDAAQERAPEELVAPVDHDFHSSWGSVYSTRGFTGDERARELWKLYATNPGAVERQYHLLLSEYTEKFHSFFKGYWPISLHAHVSDVLVPTTMASLILNTASTCPLIIESPELSPMLNDDPEPEKIQIFVRNLLGWTESHVKRPRFATVEGIYGSGSGPLAHASHEWEYNIIATGDEPVMIRSEDFAPDRLLPKLIQAKQNDCIAVIVDLVSTSDGSVFSPENFKLLRECCDQAKLFLVVDEAMTAIRCGAPWACQREEYYQAGLEPDMVVFGKGLCVSGIAMNFDGLMMKHLKFQERAQITQSIRFWRALISRPVAVPVLIESLGILNLADAEDWAARSLQIGRTVRSFISDHAGTHCKKDHIPTRGLGAFIAVDRDISKQFCVMAAIRRRSNWVRWLPKLDSGAVDRKALEQYVVGPQGRVNRRALSKEAEEQQNLPLWCFVCGINATEKDWCRTCFLGTCENEDCVDSFSTHGCV
ncbi:hypothetical protein N7466_007330 [Penicillium verhagenii]|uniref:uncharacterized protein n=1 Tax=Penicillium verhagenii TaxID=1562060 RepID=UPI002545A764|nr:uncharacterized protein N7466_007330 [Penicillium verhagenii]KAJ5928374.1 hypothetical protein N7466_007330 [Penicillium verhagenii]